MLNLVLNSLSCFCLFNTAMSKKHRALPSHVWEKRLQSFAEEKRSFGRGELPPKASEYAKKIERIKSCPKHGNAHDIDVLGKPVACKCGYHARQPKVREHVCRSLKEVTCSCSRPLVSPQPPPPPLLLPPPRPISQAPGRPLVENLTRLRTKIWQISG